MLFHFINLQQEEDIKMVVRAVSGNQGIPLKKMAIELQKIRKQKKDIREKQEYIKK